MGVVTNITHKKFPKQTLDVGRKVSVYFHYDTLHSVDGEIIRDDAEAPFNTIIKLENGNTVLATECQYSFKIED